MANDTPQILITAQLNKDISLKNFKQDLEKIEKQLPAMSVSLNFDGSKVKNNVQQMAQQVNNSVKTIKLETLDKQAEKLNKGIEKYYYNTKDIISKVKKDFSSLGSVNVSNLFDSKGKVSGFIADVTKANGVIEKYQYNLQKIQVGLTDKGNAKTRQGFVYSGGTGIDKNAGSNLQSTLNYLNKIDERIGTIQSKATKQTNPLQENTEQYSNYITKLDEVKNRISEITKSNQVLSNEHKREIGLMVNDLKNYTTEQQKAAYPPNKLASKSLPDNIKIETSSLDVLKQEWAKQGILVDDFEGKVKELYTSLAKINTPQGLIDYKTTLAQVKSEATQLNSSLNLETNIKNVNAQITTLENKFKSLGNSKFIPENLSSEISSIRTQLTSIETIDNPEDKVKAYNTLTQSVQKLNNAYKTAAQSTKLLNQDKNLSLDKVKLTNSIEAWTTKNSKALKIVGTELDEIKSKVNAADRATLTGLTKEFSSVQKEAQAAGVTGRNFVDEIKNDLTKVTQWLGASTIIFGAISEVKQMISTVSDLNAAATQIQMATGGTAQETAKLVTQYNALAIQLGATTTEVTASADSFLRQGKSISDTSELIKDSMTLSKIGQLESGEATTYLTSVTKGYNIAVKDTMSVVDALSAVDMQSATSAGGLAEALSKTSNVANLSGVSMNRLIGYVATVGEITQKSMDEVGTSFQAIFSRMGNVSANKDVDAEGESLNNVQTVLDKLNIHLRDSQGNFRNFGTVLDEVANKWKTYNNVEQNQIGTAIAGTRQRENFTVLMQNYTTALKYATTAEESNGTADKKMEVYKNSLEAATKRATASFEAFSSSVLNSDLVKFFINLGADGTSALTAINKQFGTLPTIIGVATAALSGFKNVGKQYAYVA